MEKEARGGHAVPIMDSRERYLHTQHTPPFIQAELTRLYKPLRFFSHTYTTALAPGEALICILNASIGALTNSFGILLRR